MILLGLLACAPVADGVHPRVVERDWKGSAVLLHELGPPELSVLDAVDEPEAVYTLRSQSFAYDLSAHPLTGALALSYTPPPDEGEAGWDRSWIGELGADGEVHRLGCHDEPGVWCFFPEWSADGESLWFVDGEGSYASTGAAHGVGRLWPSTGRIEEVVPWATEPAVSSDGRHVAWIGVDPVDGSRSLVLGDADGDRLMELVAPGDLGDLGRPTFSYDNEAVLAVVLEPDDGAWHGVHDRPGAWWRFPLDGGPATPLTDASTIHYDGVDTNRGLLSATREGIVRYRGRTAVEERATREVRAITWLP